jgi:hypothetical protein
MAKQKRTTKIPDGPTRLTNIVLAVSALLALQFAYHVCWSSQQYAWFSVENTPKTYSAVVAVALAVYVWMKGDRQYQRYAVVSILTALAVSFVIWLLGDTAAGQYLRGANGFWA